eukprot:5536718-Prymnesium_polylepis.1
MRPRSCSPRLIRGRRAKLRVPHSITMCAISPLCHGFPCVPYRPSREHPGLHTSRETYLWRAAQMDLQTIEVVNGMFFGADTNGDRQLSQEEFLEYCKGQGVPKKRAGQLWAKVDENGNGKVNHKEFKLWAQDMLAPEAVSRVMANED